MRFQTPLVPARLLRRYKRFLADMELADGRAVTVHCPNPGSMMGLCDPGLACWLERARPGRGLPYAWRLVELGAGHWAGIDTTLPNRLVAEALAAGAIPELAAYPEARAEVRYGAASRVDFVLSAPGRPDLYLEVKNVHLRRAGTIAEFPDCVTARGARHMAELAAAVRAGNRAAVLFVVQRTDCDRLRLAADLDPAYARAFAAARAAGVAAIAHAARIAPDGVTLGPALPVEAP